MDCEFIGWCALKPEVQAAWVQAVGSIAAIAVAVVVPLMVAAKERRRVNTERLFRAKSYAFVLRPQVVQVRNRILSARYRWNQNPTAMDYDHIIEPLAVPDGITDKLLDMHEVAEAGIHIQQMMIAVDQTRRDVADQHDYWRYGGMVLDEHNQEVGELPEPNDVDESFRNALEAVDKALAALDRVLQQEP